VIRPWTIWIVATLAACSSKDVPEPVTGDSLPAAPAVPVTSHATVTLDDFRGLHWIEGRWRGFMADGKTFYESYQVQNDSTIVMTGYPDSTFSRPTDNARIVLRGGKVMNEAGVDGGPQWFATRLDSTGADFAPGRGARNAFTWARESPTRWTATLRWTDRDGRPQTAVYALHKIQK
jgi:hypothetical protein